MHFLASIELRGALGTKVCNESYPRRLLHDTQSDTAEQSMTE